MVESQLMQEMLHTGLIHLMQINALHISIALYFFRKVHGTKLFTRNRPILLGSLGHLC